MSAQQPARRIDTPVDRPQRFIFVLLHDFTMLSFASAVEALRIANRMSGRTLYEWKTLGEDGEAVSSCAGIRFQVDGDLEEVFWFAVSGIVISAGAGSLGYKLVKYRGYLVWYSRRLWRAMEQLAPANAEAVAIVGPGLSR